MSRKKKTERDIISGWDAADCRGLMAHVKNLWWAPAWGWHERNRKEDGLRWREYHLSTGGHSDNEGLIISLQKNVMFWLTCWESSRRGGHFVFSVRAINKPKDEG